MGLSHHYLTSNQGLRTRVNTGWKLLEDWKVLAEDYFLILLNKLGYHTSQNRVSYTAIKQNPKSQCLKIIKVYFLTMLLDNCTLPCTYHRNSGVRGNWQVNNLNLACCARRKRPLWNISKVIPFTFIHTSFARPVT